MGNGVQDDPRGNTSSPDPAGASSSVTLSGEIPGYSMKVGDTPTKGGPFEEALRSGKTRQMVSLVPENQIISVNGGLAAINQTP